MARASSDPEDVTNGSALSGFRIVDVSQVISGPVCTRILGDQGADVVKVEPLGGDLTRLLGGGGRGMSPVFATSNRNKRSLALDLKSERGVEAVRRLARGADVFVQNFRPGAAERLGIGEAALRAENPRLVYVSISGFGEKGPYAHKRVYDPVIQALSGLAAIQGDRLTGRPRMVRTIVPDKLTALTAAQAITAALLTRERTGEGQHVRLSMLDAMVSFLWPEGMARYTFSAFDARGDGSAVKQVRDLVFETADGYITAGVVADREWQALAEAVERPDWLEDDRFKTAAGRVAHWDERLELMQEALLTRTTAEWLEILDHAQVPCAPINGRKDLLSDPQISANQLIVEVDHPAVGPVRQTRAAARFDRTPADLRLPAPALGEHTEEVLRELGLSAAEIQALRDAKAVA
jgi:crotonobetainyl-CoA:carnitine CoA-transferase CaiB-like acyl-CoA transferase